MCRYGRPIRNGWHRHDLDGQERLVEDLAKNYFCEYFALNTDPLSPPGIYSRNVGYGGTDGAMLYSIIRLRKPRRIIEIGSGNSTLLAIIAARKNQEDGAPPCYITSIEPHPAPYLRAALAGSGEILQRRVETVSLDRFMALDENDILFIELSHTVRVGGDVIFEINEVLPRLRKGVVVHIHDICFPRNYLGSLLSRCIVSGQNSICYRRSLRLTRSTGCYGAFPTCRLSDRIYCASIFRITMVPGPVEWVRFGWRRSLEPKTFLNPRRLIYHSPHIRCAIAGSKHLCFF